MERILILVGCLIFFANTAYANEAVGNVVVVIGSVSVQRVATGDKEILAAQHELFLNDVIITGADGLAKLLLRDETILKISPNSEVVISEMIAGPDAEGRSTVDLLKGRLRSVIGNKLGANTTFDINTPVAVAGVRGTDFEVVHLLVNGEWVSGIRCYDGSVLVAAAEAGLEVQDDIILLPAQFSLATAGTGASGASDIDSDLSLADVMGAPEVGWADGDEQLDAQEIENVLLELLNLDADELDSVVQSIDLNPNAKESDNAIVPVQPDTQLETITETVTKLPGVTIEFEVDMPLPGTQ
ncbi:FecR domain-containing protein [Reinekea sp.]|uniref:FecR family protein n=1 Tax=Reinekea sp. TaxID=1970455 RepID=UPI003989BD13